MSIDHDKELIENLLLLGAVIIMLAIIAGSYLDREQGLYVDRTKISYAGMVNGR